MLPDHTPTVIPGQKREARLRADDPGIHLYSKPMDGRVKPGHDS